MDLIVEAVDLHTVLEEALEMVQLRADQGGIALTLNAGPLPQVVRTDAAKLRQVLLNLLSNAVKFAEAGSVRLDLHSRELGDARVGLDFAVSDTGPGIAAADLERIFQPFVQADTPATQAGTGLGLTISREFVRLMGGTLAVESTPGQGSTFRFTLEVERGTAMLATPGRDSHVVGLPPSERGHSILIADDNADGRELLRDLLEPLGFVVHEAHDGQDAEEKVAAIRPDLVFMDWRMPRLDGLAATRRIRARHDIIQPKIVVLTASAFEEERREAESSGADDFLRKPVEHAQLFDVLARQLGLHFQSAANEEDTPAWAARQPLQADDLAALDLQVLADLKRAVAEMHTVRIGAAIVAIGAQYPQVGMRLQAMIERAQYQQLWSLLHQRVPG